MNCGCCFCALAWDARWHGVRIATGLAEGLLPLAFAVNAPACQSLRKTVSVARDLVFPSDQPWGQVRPWTEEAQNFISSNRNILSYCTLSWGRKNEPNCLASNFLIKVGFFPIIKLTHALGIYGKIENSHASSTSQRQSLLECGFTSVSSSSSLEFFCFL